MYTVEKLQYVTEGTQYCKYRSFWSLKAYQTITVRLMTIYIIFCTVNIMLKKCSLFCSVFLFHILPFCWCCWIPSTWTIWPFITSWCWCGADLQLDVGMNSTMMTFLKPGLCNLILSGDTLYCYSDKTAYANVRKPVSDL